MDAPIIFFPALLSRRPPLLIILGHRPPPPAPRPPATAAPLGARTWAFGPGPPPEKKMARNWRPFGTIPPWARPERISRTCNQVPPAPPLFGVVVDAGMALWPFPPQMDPPAVAGATLRRPAPFPIPRAFPFPLGLGHIPLEKPRRPSGHRAPRPLSLLPVSRGPSSNGAPPGFAPRPMAPGSPGRPPSFQNIFPFFSGTTENDPRGGGGGCRCSAQPNPCGKPRDGPLPFFPRLGPPPLRGLVPHGGRKKKPRFPTIGPGNQFFFPAVSGTNPPEFPFRAGAFQRAPGFSAHLLCGGRRPAPAGGGRTGIFESRFFGKMEMPSPKT